MDQKFFIQPFAFAGDRTVVPEDVQPSGSVSFNQGWGFDYQRELGVDPLAKPIERGETNYLLYSVTDALGQLQREGAPQFITTADNDGAPFPYARGAIVRYRVGADPFRTYISRTDTNTTLPSDTTNWAPLTFEVSTTAQAEAGLDDSTIMTPLKVKQAIDEFGGSVPAATTVIAGISRYATLAEANAQTVTTAAVTPSALAGHALKSGADITGVYRWRGNTKNAQFFDNNLDVACLEIAAGLGSATDRGAILINRNASGSIAIQAGNGSCQLNMAPTIWHFNTGGNVTGGITATGTVAANTVVIGTGATEGTLHFTVDNWYMFNNAGAFGWFSPTGGNAMSYTKSNGLMSFQGACIAAGGFQNGSSRELKTEGRPNPYGLETILQLETRIAKYHPWACKDGRERVFLISENVEAHAPEPVIKGGLTLQPEGPEGPEASFDALDYIQIIPMLVKAVQDQHAEVQELRAEIARLVGGI